MNTNNDFFLKTKRYLSNYLLTRPLVPLKGIKWILTTNAAGGLGPVFAVIRCARDGGR
jgi:hypothetical protein